MDERVDLVSHSVASAFNYGWAGVTEMMVSRVLNNKEFRRVLCRLKGVAGGDGGLVMVVSMAGLQ
jgi:hypothetical protein